MLLSERLLHRSDGFFPAGGLCKLLEFRPLGLRDLPHVTEILTLELMRCFSRGRQNSLRSLAFATNDLRGFSCYLLWDFLNLNYGGTVEFRKTGLELRDFLVQGFRVPLEICR